MRDFQVKNGVMGYIVNIGCQVAGFSNKEDLLKAITEYVNDPEATEKKYYHGSAGLLGGAAIQQQRVRDLPEIDHRTFGMTATQVAAQQQGGSDELNPSVDRAKRSEMPVLKTGDSPEPTDPIAHWNTGSNRIG
jgi:hypothetical protein